MFGLFKKRKHDCRSSGYGSPTRICEHLSAGQHLGWFVRRDPDDADASWPDAWCGACNEMVVAAGKEADRAVAAIRFSSVCDGCYERHRDRNWPGDSEGQMARLLGRAKTELALRQQRLRARYDLDRFDWFEWEDETHRLLLSKRATGQRVAATVQIVGSFSHRTHTWFWNWGRDDKDEREKQRLREIRRHGEENALLKLAVPHWPGDERDAWDMTAIACLFVASEGIYRTPHENGHTYMLVLAVEELSQLQ